MVQLVAVPAAAVPVVRGRSWLDRARTARRSARRRGACGLARRAAATRPAEALYPAGRARSAVVEDRGEHTHRCGRCAPAGDALAALLPGGSLDARFRGAHPARALW